MESRTSTPDIPARHSTSAPAHITAVESLARALVEPLIRILVVDDDHGIRRLMRRILEKEGYLVVSACDAATALHTASAAMSDPHLVIHLVLTDIDMPGDDGAELGNQLAARWPILPVIYMSGNTHGLRGRHLVSEHAHFIEKPFPAKSLLSKVGVVLNLAAQALPPADKAYEPRLVAELGG
jgi:DNA-binding NtrC family response regulator